MEMTRWQIWLKKSMNSPKIVNCLESKKFSIRHFSHIKLERSEQSVDNPVLRKETSCKFCLDSLVVPEVISTQAALMLELLAHWYKHDLKIRVGAWLCTDCEPGDEGR